jgi:hypothetical protein
VSELKHDGEPNFRAVADVEAFAQKYGRDYVIGLSMDRKLHPDNRQAVNAWYWWEGQKANERSLAATEASAKAAEASAQTARDSLRHAEESARWAKWAVIAAVAALFVSAWPFIH